MSSTTPGTAITARIAVNTRVAAAELQPGQGVAGQRVEEHPADGDEDGHDDGVDEPQREVGLPKSRSNAAVVNGSGIRRERVAWRRRRRS